MHSSLTRILKLTDQFYCSRTLFKWPVNDMPSILKSCVRDATTLKAVRIISIFICYNKTVTASMKDFAVIRRFISA